MMKRVILPILACTLLLFSSCERNETSLRSTLEQGADFREFLEGSYVGKGLNQTQYQGDTTITHQSIDTLVVAVDWESIDSIWINNWLIPISENGRFSGYYAVPGYSEFNAEFAHDTLKIKAGIANGTQHSTYRCTAIKMK